MVYEPADAEAFEAGGDVAGRGDLAGDLDFGPRPLFVVIEEESEDRAVDEGVRFGFG